MSEYAERRAVPMRVGARRLVPVLADVLLAVLLVPFVLQDVLHPAHPVALLALADAALVLPLVGRRRHPLLVFWTIFGLLVVLAPWDYRLTGAVALVVALYSVAALAPERRTLVAAIASGAAVVVAAVLVGGHAWPVTAVSLLSVVAAAAGLGLYVRARGALITRLQQDVLRVEADRERYAELRAARQRGELAREVHDVVAHHLTVIVALADGAARTVGTAPEPAAEAMRIVAGTGRRALADTRALIGVLHRPDRDDPAPPAGELRDLPQLLAVFDQAGLATELVAEGETDRLGTRSRLLAYRVVQEALTNSLKHAGPGSRAEVRLTADDSGMAIVVRDEASGHRLQLPLSSGGEGLPGLRQQVEAAGGRLAAGPTDGGWELTATMPPDRPEASRPPRAAIASDG